MNDTKVQVLKALRDRPMNFSQLATVTGITRSGLAKILRHLQNANRVAQHTYDDDYYITPKGLNHPDLKELI